MILTVVASLAAAACYAFAAVFQQEAAADAPRAAAMRLSLLVHLARRGRWLAGTLADVAGFGLTLVALAQGSLIEVQMLLVSGLFLALPLGAARCRRRLGAREWAGVAMLTAGLLVLILGAPDERDRLPAAAGWVLIGAITLIPAAALAASRPAGPARLAAATGLVYGGTAALAKATGDLLRHGVVATATSWQPYALIALGLWGMVLNQSAFQAGPLAVSLPVLTAAEPITATVIAVLVFGERPTIPPVLTPVALAAVVAGILTLTRSPLVLAVHRSTPPQCTTGESPPTH